MGRTIQCHGLTFLSKVPNLNASPRPHLKLHRYYLTQSFIVMTKAPSSKSNAMRCAEWRAKNCNTPESAASFRQTAAQLRAARRADTKRARRVQDAQQGRLVRAAHQGLDMLRAYESTLQQSLAFSSNLFGSALHRQPEMLITADLGPLS